MSHVLVIGAGASGLMAAIAAAENGHSVTVLEKNEKAGKKIYITGKGRCNLTNDTETSEFFSNVVRSPKFLYSAVYSFDHDAVKDLMRQNGCEVKTERGLRVFPCSDHASDVTAALLKMLKKTGTEIRYHSEVTGLIVENGRAQGVILKNGNRQKADSVIVCTGGCSYSSTGSTGDGYRFAAEEGLNVITPAPSLVPLNTVEEWPRSLAGLSLKNVSVTVFPCGDNPVPEKGRKKRKPLYSGFGEMLFTHRGVSGPLILSASSYCDFRKYPDGFIIHIDLKPAIPVDELVERIRNLLQTNAAMQFGNAVRSVLPLRLLDTINELSGIDCHKKADSVGVAEIRSYAELLKNVELHADSSAGFSEAIVTMGGVDVKEIDPSTMECRKIRELYFAGEVLDTDALTGGFNLQIAWSTGHLAGSSACRDE